MDMPIVLKVMKLAANVLQIGGLIVASRMDLKSKAIEAAEEQIPGNPFLEAFNAAMDGTVRTESAEELHHRALEALHNPARNAILFKTSVGMIAAGMLIQLIVDLVE